MKLFCEPTSYADTLTKLKESKEAEVAGAFAGTGIPIFDSVLKSLSESLSSLTSAAAASLVDQAQTNLTNYINERIDDQLVSTALANIVALLNVGSELTSAVRMMMVHNLRRQASLRLILMSEMQFHARGILSVLNYLAQPYRQNSDPRLRQAYPYILAALKQFRKLREMAKDPKPRFNIQLYRAILANIDRAIDILTGTRSSTAAQKFIKSINRKTNAAKLTKQFQDYIFDDFLSEQIIRAETYIWHLTNFLAVVAGGAYPASLGAATLVTGNNIPGLDPNRKNLLVERKKLLEQEKAKWRMLTPKAIEPFKTMEWIDVNKGLVFTHELALQGADIIVNFDVSWNTMSASANTLWAMMSPGFTILESTEGEVKNHLDKENGGNNTSSLPNTLSTSLLFIPYVASKLSASKTMIRGFGKAGEDFEAVAVDQAVWENIQRYLKGQSYLGSMKAIATLLHLVPKATALAVAGPLNRQSLQKALIVFNEIDRSLSIAIAEERQLLQVLAEFNIMDNPGVMAAMNSLNAAAGQSPVAAAIANSLVTGQAGSVAAMFMSVVSAVKSIKEMFSGCTTIKKETAKNNAKATENADIFTVNQPHIAKQQEELRKTGDEELVDGPPVQTDKLYKQIFESECYI
ncbi:MAG: hypothetical protein WC666_03295 [Candidatus Paceibacterota bacterium]|jgi:hypothetical protein